MVSFRHAVKIIIIFSVVFPMMAINGVVANETYFWKRSVVDTEHKVGDYTCIAIDNNGNPHIAYVDETFPGSHEIRWAYFSGGFWYKKMVDRVGYCEKVSLALDSNNNPHFFYTSVKKDETAVIYAVFKNGDWSIELIDKESNAAKYSASFRIDSRSIAIDPLTNEATFCYTNIPKEQLLKSWVGSNIVVDSSSVIPPESLLKFGFPISNGYGGWADILYSMYDYNPFSYGIRLKYYKSVGGISKYISPPISQITTRVELALTYGDNNTAHLLFNSEEGLMHGKVRPIVNDSEWSMDDQRVYSKYAQWPSIALDSKDRPHASFYDPDSQNMIYSVFDDYVQWENEIVKTPEEVNGFGPSIGIDQFDMPHISYVEGTDLIHIVRSVCADLDEDGYCDSNGDNCPDVSNPSQADTDGDGFGDECDYCPNRPSLYNVDSDYDGIGDACDNCKFIYNSDQLDSDVDDLGDPAPDGVGDVCDNCPDLPNGPWLGSCIPEDWVGVAPKRPPTCELYAIDICQENCIEMAIENFRDCRRNPLSDEDSCIEEAETSYSICINQCDCSIDRYCSAAQEDMNNNGTGDACEPFSPSSFGLKIEHNDTIRLGQSIPYYEFICLSNWCPPSIFSLKWGGSTMKLKVSTPSGKPYKEITSSSGLIKINVPKPQLGAWGVEVVAIADIPSDEPYPFTLKIESDRDEDGLVDNSDPCPSDPLNDTDQDNICGDIDNCPSKPNQNQLDLDNDGVGDKCDNCRFVSNADQKDTDNNGVGDACTRNIEIDIKIKVASLKRKGVIPVAILSDINNDFDPANIDPDSIRLQGVSPIHDLNDLFIYQNHFTEDINNDGIIDPVIHFKVNNLESGIFKATLHCSSYEGGDLFVGNDIVQCK